MKFSLISVSKQTGDKIEGNWVQNHIGTLDTAVEVARRTEEVNGNQIDVAVVEEVVSVVPMLECHTSLTRLDVKRNAPSPAKLP